MEETEDFPNAIYSTVDVSSKKKRHNSSAGKTNKLHFSPPSRPPPSRPPPSRPPPCPPTALHKKQHPAVPKKPPQFLAKLESKKDPPPKPIPYHLYILSKKKLSGNITAAIITESVVVHGRESDSEESDSD